MTGWALDDIEVSSVVICRAAVAGEAPVATAPCGGAAQFFVGSGLFIDGARPDVQATYPTYPMASRAGWGFMILTNMLPGRGNGTYQLFAYAHDVEGRARLLGNRVITCDNAHAIKPFGTIDTPTQGGTASGTSFVNFGWALTPLPKTIPTNGSTITVLVDGVSRGTVSYNHPRSDIAALFPGYNNSNGPVGFRILDTSTLTNGLHTISWVVTDDRRVREGIGSRFFSVSNTGAPFTENAAGFSPAGDDTATASASGGVALRSERASAAPRDTRTPLVGRRGWDLSAPLETFEPNASGTIVVRSQEVNRVELRLPPGQYTGHLRRADGLAPLPVGAVLDEERWHLHVGAGRGLRGRIQFDVRALGGAAAGLAQGRAHPHRTERKRIDRSAGRHRYPGLATGRCAALPARRLGGRSECGAGDRRGRGARLGVSIDRRRANFPGGRCLRWVTA